MPAILRHFAINADDVSRAKAFYETVLGWTFTPWGPPDFYQIGNAGAGVMGALQERRNLLEDRPLYAFETSFQVDDLRATLAAAEANGGRTVLRPYTIDGVGDIGYFQDTEGNLVGLGQYLPGRWT